MTTLLDLKKVLDKTCFSESTIRRYIKAGTFPAPRQIGRNIRWTEEDIENWISQHPIAHKLNGNAGLSMTERAASHR